MRFLKKYRIISAIIVFVLLTLPSAVDAYWSLYEKFREVSMPSLNLGVGIWLLPVAGLVLATIIIWQGRKNNGTSKEDKQDINNNLPLLEDIKSDLLNMNKIQREVANQKLKQICPEEKGNKISDDFTALFGPDLKASAVLRIKKIVENCDIDILIDFFKKFGDLLDSNDYGLKIELENNEAYKSYRIDMAKKRLGLKLNKDRNAIIQKNIDRVYSLIYGLNSTILLKSILNSSPKVKEILPAQIKITLEGIEALAEQNLNIMLVDLENEWKVTITEIPNESYMDKLLKEATNKAEELIAREQVRQREELLVDIRILILEGTDVLQQFKAVDSHSSYMPIKEFKEWRKNVFRVLDNNKLNTESTLFFRDVYIDDEHAVLKDFIQSCEAGLDRLEEIVKAI